MLRFLLKMAFLAWFSLVLLLLATLTIGKSTLEISKIAFFRQEFDGTDYWRLDLFTGVAFKDEYTGLIFIPNDFQSPLPHFLSVIGDANYYNVSEVNLYTQELSFVAYYPSRGYNMLLAGDYIFTYDLASQWRRIYIPSGDLDYFGRFPTLSNPQVSPDGQWLAGRIYTGNMLFIHVLDGRTYEIPNACCVQWSPDNQWFILSSLSSSAISVYRSEDGTQHLGFPQNLPASFSRWSYDGQAIIFYRSGSFLSSIELSTNEFHDYPNRAEAYELACLSPNQRYILTWDFETKDYHTSLALEDLETGQRLWSLPRRNFSNSPQCVWSTDSRYLAFYAFVTNNGRHEERIFFIDTQNNASWDVYPANLSGEPVYLHIPD
jgi:WD40 repeat protein